jgi:hypothetical protein
MADGSHRWGFDYRQELHDELDLNGDDPQEVESTRKTWRVINQRQTGQ